MNAHPIVLRLAFSAAIAAIASAASAQDVLTAGNASVGAGSVARVPLFVRDATGTPLGSDSGPGKRIQGFAFRVTCSPAGAVSTLAFERAGVLQPLQPLHETTLPGAGSISYIAVFPELTSSVPFAAGAPEPGDRIGTLSVGIHSNVAPGTAIAVTIDPLTATLSNETGSVTSGALIVRNGTITVLRPSATSLIVSPNPARAGERVTLSAAVGSPVSGTLAGTVTFFSGSAAIGSAAVSGGTARFESTSLAPGTHVLTAAYDGDVAYGQSSSAPVTLAVELPPFGAPAGIAASAAGASAATVTWLPVAGAAGYEVHRRSGSDGWTVRGVVGGTSFTDSDLAVGTAYLYKVRVVNAAGATSPFSPVDPVVTVAFSTDPLNTGAIMRAAHLVELQSAINALRAAAGLPPAAFTAIARGAIVRAAHLTELRNALTAALDALGLQVVYSDPAIAAGATRVKAIHIRELRDALR